MAKKKSIHYVDNKKFLQAMIDWRESWPDEENIPPVTNYIGECFLKIATHLSYKPNFINYTYREDMISDGIENCLQYVKNFNPEKSKNPFAYFTQITYYAFLRIIHKEKKQVYIKHLVTENSGILENLEGEDVVVEVIGNLDVKGEFKRKGKKRNKGKSLGSLEEFME